VVVSEKSSLFIAILLRKGIGIPIKITIPRNRPLPNIEMIRNSHSIPKVYSANQTRPNSSFLKLEGKT
jgi:hypothetical protein